MEVKRVTKTEANRRLFRQVARDSCGETYSPPDTDRILFVYNRKSSDDKAVVGVACYQAAWLHVKKPSTEAGADFLDNFFHILTYLFVRPYHQGQGVGSLMLDYIERELHRHARRPIRLQSAWKACPFFLRNGFQQTGDTVDCVCGGSPLFSTLVNMEKDIT